MRPFITEHEPLKVNLARTEVYRKSTVPNCQHPLNFYYMEHHERLGKEPRSSDWEGAKSTLTTTSRTFNVLSVYHLFSNTKNIVFLLLNLWGKTEGNMDE